MKTLLVSLLLSTQVGAQVSTAVIKNFNFNYRAPTGEGVAESFSYQKAVREAQVVRAERVGDEFRILLEGAEDRELNWKGAPDLIIGADVIKLSAFNLNYAGSLELTAVSGFFQSPLRILSFKSLSLSCDRNYVLGEATQQLITGCFQKLQFRASAFNSEGEGFDQAVMKALDQGHNELLAKLGAKNIDLKISSGKFNLSADVQAQVSGTVKSKGVMTFEAPLKKVTVKIDEVKFGFLNVTSKVFDELKKQESDSVKVSKPYVYIFLK